jgi:5,10-methylene-tetrahydrofolate dehydrogenase/methenyl tetrahydrofolate cyclohydrolase
MDGAVMTPRPQVPGLAVVIVGSRKDSQTYVNMKRKACAEVGIRSVDVDLPEDISELALVAEVHRLNADPAVHGTASPLLYFSGS